MTGFLIIFFQESSMTQFPFLIYWTEQTENSSNQNCIWFDGPFRDHDFFKPLAVRIAWLISIGMIRSEIIVYQSWKKFYSYFLISLGSKYMNNSSRNGISYRFYKIFGKVRNQVHFFSSAYKRRMPQRQGIVTILTRPVIRH